MPRFFISYRRDDSAYPAHAIYDRLTAHFGAGSVVFDVDSIPLGIDFVEYLDEQVRQCDVLLALIGDSWTIIADPDGKRRLHNPDDFVRIEIAAALKRGIPVVPVLVGRARMPKPEQLPSNLRKLVRRNAAEVRAGQDFVAHLDRLVAGLDRVLNQLGSQPAKSPAHVEPAQLPAEDGTARISERPRSRTKSKLKPSKLPEERPPVEQPEVNPNEAGLTVDERTGITFVRIPPGRFHMGSDEGYDDEKPVHEVHITREFLLGRYPVTNAQYARFLEAAGKAAREPAFWSDPSFNRAEQPVVGVSWDEAQAFCKWAGCRLPTEAEWEYACRAGTATEYSFGDDAALLSEYGWFDGNSGNRTQPVRTKKANPWGLYDMHGNVWEWCQDWFSEVYYGLSPAVDPPGPPEGSNRVYRGGSWGGGAMRCRSADRGRYSPAFRSGSLGFRVTRRPSGK